MKALASPILKLRNPCLIATILLLAPLNSLQAQKSTLVLDAVVASVDGRPITLSEVSQRLPGRRKVSLETAGADHEFQEALQSIIFEYLLEEESQTRRVGVSDDEIASYIQEVAKRNNLSVEQFAEALKTQGGDLESYRQRLRLEILRSKLVSNFAQNQAIVSEDEITEYLNSHPKLMREEPTLTISQIFIAKSSRSMEEAQARVAEVMKKLGENFIFADLAKEYSDAPEAAQGGVLGNFTAADLNAELSAQVKDLQPEQYTQPIETAQGYRIVRLDRLIDPEKSKDAARAEVRKQLQQQKFQEKAYTYLTTEMQKNHAVERKL
jgi:peptidyl-prolyl cis-trans isomerase SurA